MSIGKATPPKVVEGIVSDLGAARRHQKSIIAKTAEDWGVSEAVVNAIMQKKKPDIMMLREAAAGRYLVLGSRNQDRIAEALEDDARMKSTSIRDLAIAGEKMTNAAITLIDGHQAKINFNIGDVKSGMKVVEAYDREKAARKAAITI